MGLEPCESVINGADGIRARSKSKGAPVLYFCTYPIDFSLPPIVVQRSPPTSTLDSDASCSTRVSSGALVDELSAQLDRHRSRTVWSSEDAASNALARFDHNDIETGIVQCAPQ